VGGEESLARELTHLPSMCWRYHLARLFNNSVGQLQAHTYTAHTPTTSAGGHHGTVGQLE